MKEVSLVLIALLILPLILGEDVSLNYPSSVLVGEEFDINTELVGFSEDIYDVKFEVLNESENIAERYWDDEWKSSNYWIEDCFNLSESSGRDFRLRIGEYEGRYEVKIKIRNSSDSVEEFGDFYIDVTKNESSVGGASDETYFELEWDEDEIQNKKDFKIKINGFNLEDREYDVKVWIEFDDEEGVFSERYDSDEEEWKSGYYYVNGFFKDPGNESRKIKLRLKEDEEDFVGEANLFFKTREGFEIEETIEVINKETEKIENKAEEKVEVLEVETNENFKDITANVIKLGEKRETSNDVDGEQEDLKVENYIVYESKTEKVKKYAVYFFALLCIFLSVLISWRKLE